MRALVDRAARSASRRRAPAAAEQMRAPGTPRAASSLARERVERLLDPGTAFLELSPLAAHGMYDGDAPGAGIVTGIGAIARPPGGDRRQRRHREGRHLLPAHGEEAPARAGDRAREPPALRLPGRLGRRVPAAPGRGLPRPRALRPHLLQPGAHVGGRHPAGRGRHGLVHGGRRLRAGDVRRGRDRRRTRARSSSAARRW